MTKPLLFSERIVESAYTGTEAEFYTNDTLVTGTRYEFTPNGIGQWIYRDFLNGLASTTALVGTERLIIQKNGVPVRTTLQDLWDNSPFYTITEINDLLDDIDAEVGTKITGPASSVDNNLVSFNGVTGKVAKDSGILSTDVATLSGTQTFSGAKTFSTSPSISSNDPAIILQENDTTTNARMVIAAGKAYIQASAAGSGGTTSSGDLIFSGYNGTDIGAFQVIHGGALRNIYHSNNVSTDLVTINNAQTISGLKTISPGNSTTLANFMNFQPTNYSTGNPRLSITKLADATKWNIQLFDGTNSNGTINLNSQFVTWNDVPLATTTNLASYVALAGAQTITGLKTVSTGTATTNNTYLNFQPTDWGTGKPRLQVDKSTTADVWTVALWDGTNNSGTINISASNFTWNGSALVTAASAMTLSGAQTVTGLKTVSLGTSTTFAAYFMGQPTDYGTGKPRLAIEKAATATQWNIGLWDGTNSNGTININSSDFTWNGNAVLSSSAIGSTVQAYDVDTAKIDVAQQWTAPQRSEITALTSGTTITMDLANSNDFSLILGHNATLANPTNQSTYVGLKGSIACVQDATGGRTLAFGANWFPIGAATAPAAPTGANAKFRIDFHVVDSSRIDFKLSSVGV